MVKLQKKTDAVINKIQAKNKPAKNAKNILIQEKQSDAVMQNQEMSEPKQPATSTSKQNLLLELLQQVGGATIEELMLATGWQQHSVRGVLSGVIKKRLGLNVTSAKEEKGRVYRIVDAVSQNAQLTLGHQHQSERKLFALPFIAMPRAWLSFQNDESRL